MFALYDGDGDLKSLCVVTREDDEIYELKNIATYEKYHGQGHDKQLVRFILEYYRGECKTMFVGKWDSPLTIQFYKCCEFVMSHRFKNFFIDNYNHPIFECDE
jgi:GNAT superfamily N-acetyltransferase